MAYRVLISAGESSGDAYGAALAKLMRAQSSDPVEFFGLGSARMRAEGVQLIADSGRWGAISIVQSLKIIPRVLLSYYKTKWWLGKHRPDLFIPIDFGYGNVRLARHAKNRGVKVLYFVPPGSWRRDRQGKDLATITDAISTPFSWSAEILNAGGAKAYWFGHPLNELLGSSETGEVRSGIAVLPGSRDHEIAENLPIIAEAVQEPVEFALAPTADTEAIIAHWKRLRPDREHDKFTIGKASEVLARHRAAIVCSGTATLEAALVGTPMVVMYRVSRSMVMEAKIIRYKPPKFVALPNILLDREVVPELIQEAATPEAISTGIADLLADGPYRQAQLDAFAEIQAILGSDQAITETAKLALSLMKEAHLVNSRRPA